MSLLWLHQILSEDDVGKGEIDCKNVGRSGGQVVSVLALYSDNPSSNPADACS